MVKDPIIAIRDCLTEIALLRTIAVSKTIDEFKVDPISRRAAAYAIQTISEAVRHIPDEWIACYPAQPWAQIRAIGNRIRHEYFRLDDSILWGIMTGEALALEKVLQAMLTEHSGKPEQ